MSNPSYNPAMEELLAEVLALHERKGHDYAFDNNPYSNFEEAAAATGLSVNQVFDVLCAIKDARIRQLERSGKPANHESIQDSYLDRLTYRALQLSYMRLRDAARH